MNPQSQAGPKGVTYEETPDGFLIRCTTRSASGLVLLCFIFVFCVLLSSYMVKAVAAVDHIALGFVAVCAWLGICILAVLTESLMRICGKVTFRLSGGVLEYFSGLWRLGRRIRIQTSLLDHATEAIEHWGRREHELHLILLEGKRRYRLGRYLSRDQREFVLHILASRLRKAER